MKLKKSLLYVISALMCALFVFVAVPVQNAFAADVSVVFGSDSYTAENGSELPIGLYISGDSPVGYYYVTVDYDTSHLEYIDGATSGGDGTVVFEGRGGSETVSTMLRFKAVSGGDTPIRINEADVRLYDTDNESFNVTERAQVNVSVSGETAVATTESTLPPAETTESAPADTQPSETTETVDPQKQGGFPVPADMGFVVPLVAAVLGGILAAVLIVIFARRSKQKKKKKENVKYLKEKYGRKKEEDKAKPEKEPGPKVEEKPVKKPEAKNEEKPAKKPEAKPVDKPAKKPEAKNEDKPAKKPEAKPVEKPAKTDAAVNTGLPVVQVKNVSMTFKVSNANASGLKDYMLQKVKRKIKTRKLNALDNVSFDVYKGEVVGIIGTNGSGKSTLLKIVSGALRPTSGEVIADKSKIQLLTLGTGFDGELSAKENVYLNGAIIGYTKEFIDAHYDEIVEFAELEDFMEEKVKNFSSGMVSRLGFSIATVAGAAEILILDEVLSVGDQFFRKKSMDRIKQMIHGGSTVLIVSHSLSTIVQHCSKVVWIEKGVLKMIGDPKKVCDAYANSHGEDV